MGPHNGLLLPLPGDHGFVEILNEGKIDRSQRKITVAAYFLRPDKQSPLESLPTDVKVEIEGTGGKTIPLSPAANPPDPLSAARLVSAPGPYLLSQRNGEVSGTLNGERFTLGFDGGRLR